MAASTVSEPTWDSHCVDRAAAHLLAGGVDLWALAGSPSPRSSKDAAAILRGLGVTSIKDAMTKVLGPPVSPLLAMRGDVVMVDNAFGICRGELVECIDRMQPLGRAECAWRVNHG